MKKIIAALCLLGLSAFAATYYWSDDVDANWETQNNWWNDADKNSQATSLPGSGDDVTWASGETSYALINSAVSLGAGTCNVDVWVTMTGAISSGTFTTGFDSDSSSTVSGGVFSGGPHQQAGVNANISGGTFSGDYVWFQGTISGGTFSGSNQIFGCTINGGTFTGTPVLDGSSLAVYGGTFSGTTVTHWGGYIMGGTFTGTAFEIGASSGNYPEIAGGTFTATATVRATSYGSGPGIISEGTFYCKVTVADPYTIISGGTFYGLLDGPFCLTGGTSYGGSTGESMLKWFPKSDIIGSGLF